MAYCAQADILEQLSEDELVGLTQDDADNPFVDEAKVTRAIADADGVINGYCAKGYTVPLSSVPDLIRGLSVDIAIYNLYSRRGAAPDLRTDRYKAAVKTLENISKGTVTLGVTPAPEENPAQAASQSGADRVFNRESMKGF